MENSLILILAFNKKKYLISFNLLFHSCGFEKQTEIIPCEGNVTKCGHGCLTTDEGAVCVCPEGSVLREDGQACTGMNYITAYQQCILIIFTFIFFEVKKVWEMC